MRHSMRDADLRKVRASVRTLNQLLLDGRITQVKYDSMKADILRLVVVSHRPVISNLFIV